jgi:hypothetical protein
MCPLTTHGRLRRLLGVSRYVLVALVFVLSDAVPHSVVAAGHERAFTIVSLPDTQYYAALHPEILGAQTDWILREHVADRIAFVVHEGDIVDHDDAGQWGRASASLRKLDGVVPYVLASGNHDYDRTGDHITRRTLLDTFFPVASFRATSCAEATFEPGRIENSCRIIDTPAGPWLVLALEFGPRDAVLAWADRAAKQYAALPAIVVTHAYLASDDTRYDHLARRDQLWNPYRYLRDDAPGEVNDGEGIWRKLIVKNDNILFVLCGHDLGDGIGRLTSVRPDGTKVHQLLANYQMSALGGGGYLRLMEFFPGRRRVRVRTYSPYLDRFKTDAANDFSLDY